jgi:hypothetical protein
VLPKTPYSPTSITQHIGGRAEHEAESMGGTQHPSCTMETKRPSEGFDLPSFFVTIKGLVIAREIAAGVIDV